MVGERELSASPMGSRGLGSGRPYVITAAAALIAALLIWRAGVGSLAVLVALVALTWVAWRLPRLAMAAFGVTALLPAMFAAVPALDTPLALTSQVRYVDIVLVGMLLAVTLRLVTLFIGERALLKGVRMWVVPLLAFGTLVLFAVVRNFGETGVASVGEFRARYLILVLIPYCALFLSTHWDWYARFLGVAGLVAVYVALPIVVWQIGLGIGPTHRYFTASMSAFLVLSLTSLILRRNELTELLRLLTYVAIPVVATVFLADGHRSVWAGTAALVLTLAVMRSDRDSRSGRWVFWGAICLLALAVVFLVGDWLVTYVLDRGSGLVQPLDDPTGSWRYAVGKAQLLEFVERPWFGQGLGYYWNVYVPDLGRVVTQQPHNTYIQVLVHMGVVGLAALVWLGVGIARALLAAVRASHPGLRRDAVQLGLGAVAMATLFGVAYSIESTILLFIGLGLAAAGAITRDALEPGATT